MPSFVSRGNNNYALAVCRLHRTRYRLFGGGGFGLGTPVVSAWSLVRASSASILRFDLPYAPRPMSIAPLLSCVIMSVETERKSARFAGACAFMRARSHQVNVTKAGLTHSRRPCSEVQNEWIVSLRWTSRRIGYCGFTVVADTLWFGVVRRSCQSSCGMLPKTLCS
jgi:hypothetical protein